MRISPIIPKLVLRNKYTNKNSLKKTNVSDKSLNSTLPSFCGYEGTTTMKNSDTGASKVFIHQTYFFRNIESLEFTTDYIKENFPQGTHIADFASSTGEEAYSLAMLLSDCNADKKYQITGYDIVPRIIDSMPTHLYDLKTNLNESFLGWDPRSDTPEKRDLKKIFECYFESIPREWAIDSLYNPSSKRVNKKLSKTSNPEEIRKLKYLLSYFDIPAQDKFNTFVVPKANAFDNVVEFKVANICDLGQTMSLPRNTGVIFFKNAFYHLMNYNDSNADLQLVNQVLSSISDELPRDGLLVIGALERDHLSKYISPRKIIYDGKEIEVRDTSKFHKTLRNNGFVPVLYEYPKDIGGYEMKDNGMLPSVWKKV